ncbi:MAG: hypothetical protein HYV48_02025 [Candidatus Omnitrophica bacterium]|nr:hypothetical protein [Candidatus Omnitrophota bacterium]
MYKYILSIMAGVGILFLGSSIKQVIGKNIAVYEWEGTVYKDKPTQEELAKEPWLFGNGKGLYLLRANTADEGGPVKPGESRNLTVAGYFGWDEGENKWERDVRYEWQIYNQGKSEKIEGPASEAANTYTSTCWSYIKHKEGEEVKEEKEDVSWILWVEKE